MADEANIQKIETKAADVAEAVKTAATKTQDKVVETAKTVASAAKAPVRKARRAATKRRARKAPAKLAKTITKTSQRTAETARRATKAATDSAATQTERMTTMAYDFTKMFPMPAFGGEFAGADQIQSMFGNAGERGQDMVRRTQKAAEDMAELTRANLEAMAEAGKIAANGAKSLGQDMLSSGRNGLELTSSAVKTLADAKSPTEFMQIQTEIVRGSFDRAVAESSKFAEAFVKLAGEAVQPLSNRATLNAERMSEIAA